MCNFPKIEYLQFIINFFIRLILKFSKRAKGTS